MSSRALRRLREEKEAALLLAEEEGSGDDESSEEYEEDNGAKSAFMMTLDEESSSDEDESSESESDDDGEEKKATTTPAKSKNKGGKKQPPKPQAEDLDAILSDMNIQSTDHTATDDTAAPEINTIRALLLSKQKGFDTQDLDLDYAMRSLVGAGGEPAHLGDNVIMGPNNAPPEQQQRRGRGRRTTLAKKYLFGKPRTEWGKPPSYVGGGLGMKELTPEVLEEERHSWSVPWPYNLNTNADGKEDDESIGGDGKESHDNNNGSDGKGGIPTIPLEEQKWYTLQMSDTYQEHNYIYQEMLSSRTNSSRDRTQAGLHDPNSLAMFVADHPYFAETVLQLAMVLYYINDRRQGNDLLRRCMFLYEAALPGNVLPSNMDGESEGSGTKNINKDGGRSELLIDIDRPPNSGLFATLFRIMQTSGMTGCHNQALATGRYLLSLDPLRDPMGVLLILDYYALASRRTSTAYLEGKEIEMGAAFIVDFVESNRITVHYKDPLTDRHFWCALVDMPNWAYSHALALYRLSKNEEEDTSEHESNLEEESTNKLSYQERAEDALVQALTRFPMVLPKLLAMNKVNTEGRSFRTDWPTVLPHFNADANDALTVSANDTVEDRVTRASGEHLVRIYVQRCHKLWKEEDVLMWLFLCAERAVQEHQDELLVKKTEDEVADVDADDGQTTSPSMIKSQDGAAAPVATTTESLPPNFPLISTFSPALARYAQCDPSEYEDAFHTFPPEAIALDPNIVAPAMALGPNGQRRRFLRGGRQQQRGGRGGDGVDDGLEGGHDPLEMVRRVLGMGGNNDGVGLQEAVEVLDPDSPLLQLYLQSLLPWAQVEGVRPPPRD